MLKVLFRNRGLAVWVGWLLLRRTLARWTRIALRAALVVTLVGALALVAWWWFTRNRGGEEWRRSPEPEPAPPPPTPEPAVPVGV
jgi:hypothetical protein